MKKTTNWDEILEFWNKTFNTKFVSHKQMLKAAYKEFSSMEELSDKLGTNPESLRLKMKREKIKLTGRGKASKTKKENM